MFSKILKFYLIFFIFNSVAASFINYSKDNNFFIDIKEKELNDQVIDNFDNELADQIFDNLSSEIKNNIFDSLSFENEENEPGVISIDTRKALEIYKIIMIFTCCVLSFILVLLLICIFKRTECLNNNDISNNNFNFNSIYTAFTDPNNSQENETYVNLNLPFEKPPSYQETVKIIQNEIGLPPPEYNNQSNLINTNMKNEVVLDINKWLKPEENFYRDNLKELSKNLERCSLPVVLKRSHSSPIIRNNLLFNNQLIVDLISSSNLFKSSTNSSNQNKSDNDFKSN